MLNLCKTTFWTNNNNINSNIRLENEFKSTQVQLEHHRKTNTNLQLQNEKLLDQTKHILGAIEELKLELKKENLAVEETESNNSKSDFQSDGMSRPYSILLSSCQQHESIKKVITKYSQIGLESYVINSDLGENGIWWRIYAGHYETRETAIKEKNRLGLTGKIVIKEPNANQADIYSSKIEVSNTKSLTVQKRILINYFVRFQNLTLDGWFL